MLIKLNKDEIVRYWDDVKDTLRYALPPNVVRDGREDEVDLNGVLEMLLADYMQAWALLGDDTVHAMVLTAVQRDVAVDTRTLLIYSLYGFSLIPDVLWKDGLTTLRQYAKDNNCIYIVGYTKVPRIAVIAKELGGDTDTTFIRLEV